MSLAQARRRVADGRRTWRYQTVERLLSFTKRHLLVAQKFDDQMQPDVAEKGLRMVEEDLAALARQVAELRAEVEVAAGTPPDLQPGASM